MLRRRARPLVLLVALALVAASAARAGPPSWLQQAAAENARALGGTRHTSVAYVGARSRFPRVILSGSFVCRLCTGPRSAPAPRGTFAAMRYDGRTHDELDFALCKQRGQCLAGLCNGAPCTHRNLLFDAAVIAREREGANASPGYRLGSLGCHVELSRNDSRYVLGSCTLTLRLLARHSAFLRYTKRWNRELRDGRWVNVPLRTHTWRVLVLHDGWVTKVTSSGDPQPALS